MQFIVMTYGLAALWMLVFALSALPVYFLYNMTSTCRTVDVLTETPASINQLCVDARQYGNRQPWSVAKRWDLNDAVKTLNPMLMAGGWRVARAGASSQLLQESAGWTGALIFKIKSLHDQALSWLAHQSCINPQLKIVPSQTLQCLLIVHLL